MKKKLAFILITLLGFVLLSALPAAACHIDSAEIDADCVSYTLTVNGSYPGDIDYELTLTPLPLTGPPSVGISIKDCFDFGSSYSETINVPWADLSLDGLSIEDFLQSGENFELTGVVKLRSGCTVYDREVIGPVTIEECAPPLSCADGKPQMLTMLLMDGECPDNPKAGNTQDLGKVSCQCDALLNSDDVVYVIAANKDK